MYKIIGVDGKEYGPVSLDQLTQWLAQTRINGDTKVKAEGNSDWQQLKTLPELASRLAPPPPIKGAASGPPPKSGWAVAALVMGILGIFSCGITAIFGLAAGLVGLNRIKKSAGRLSGTGLAIAGIVVSGLMILMLPLFAAMLIPALAKAKAKAQRISCMNSARQLTLGVLVYAGENSNRCPAAATWCDTLLPEVGSKQIFLCQAGQENDRCHFAFNAKLSALDLSAVKSPALTVMIFETSGGWNLSGGMELLPATPRHDKKIVIGFADGHVELVAESGLQYLNWEP